MQHDELVFRFHNPNSEKDTYRALAAIFADVGCKKLKNVTVGRYVKQIRYGAFMGDSKLKRVTFQGKKLKNVGDDAFYRTSSGIRFVMPKAVKTKYQTLLKDGNPRRAVFQAK